MMPLRKLFALGLAAVLLAACGEEGPPTVGEMKTFDTVCDKANDGKRVAVEGYLRFPESFSGDLSVVTRLYQAADYSGKPVGVQIRLGNQPNQVEKPPQKYTDKDLKVHLADGQVAPYGTKVKVSGTVYFPMVGQNFTCALSNPMVEPAK